MPRIKPGPPCVICGAPSVARELCDTHYRRWRRHGHTEQTRPETWGQKNQHPLWQSWKWTKRLGRVPEWNDFWTFVADVGERPGEKYALRKRDKNAPAGPENCYWAEKFSTTINDDYRAGRAAYARKWRAANPLKAKQHDLTKMFGISLAEYEAKLAAQGGVCAVCGQKDEWFSLAVDHDHATGLVRGLLCSQCNRGLGLFKDRADLLDNAAAYLRHHSPGA
jgi:hypothetical protein